MPLAPHFCEGCIQELDARAYYEARHALKGKDAWRVPESYREFVGYYPADPKGKTCLDIGCGTGWALLWAQRRGFRTYAVDISEAAARVTRSSLPHDSAIVVADALALPFRREAFDFVLALGSLEHTSDTAKAVQEAASALKPSGILVLGLPNSRFLLGAWRGTEQRREAIEELRTLREWQSLIDDAGLGVAAVHKDLGRFHPTLDGGIWCWAATWVARALLAGMPLAWTYQFIFVCHHSGSTTPGTCVPAGDNPSVSGEPH